MEFLDYLYLDRSKLEDYLSGLDDGVLESVRQVVRTGDSPPSPADPPELGKPYSSTPTTERMDERTLSISAKHLFSRLRSAMRDRIETIDGTVSSDFSLSRGQLVELTTPFELSPINQMIDSLVNLADTMRQMEAVERKPDPETQQMLQMISILFSGSKEEESATPMITTPEQGSSVLFVAKQRWILCEPEDFEGEMTLLGKVTRVVGEAEKVDLLDLLKALPRSLRRGKTADSFREAISQLFSSWPAELGGAVSPDALYVNGPAYVVDPLAVFRK